MNGVPDGEVDYEFHISIVVIITTTRNPSYVVCDLEILRVGFEILWGDHNDKLKDLISFFRETTNTKIKITLTLMALSDPKFS